MHAHQRRSTQPSFLSRLARFSYQRRRLVLLVWVVALAVLVAASVARGGIFENAFELPGTESQAAQDLLLAGGFDTRAGFQGQLVIHAESGVTDPEVQQRVAGLLDRIASDVPDVTITSPYEPAGHEQISRDGTIAFATLDMADRSDRQFAESTDSIRDLVGQADSLGLQLELGGDRFAENAGGPSEGIGVLAAAVILLLDFGSVLAMGLPIVTALFGIGSGVAIVLLLANAITMPNFTLELVIMLGLGVGIDYALFIVTRFRQGLAEGLEPQQAVEVAIDTAGRAVLFAGTTVVVSVFGLFFAGLDVNRALGIAAASGVAMTMIASVTLLPAILGFVGRGIDRLGLPHRTSMSSGGSVWQRWSRVIQRHPVLPALATLAFLVVLVLPAFSMRLGIADAGNRPASDTTRRAYALLAEGFGTGTNGPLFLAVSVPDDRSDTETALNRLVKALRATEGVAGVSPEIRNAAGDVAFIQVIPTTGPQDKATAELVHRLRQDVIPGVTADSGLTVHVGGVPAAAIDFADFNAAHLPIFIAAVLLMSFVVLLMVFRSLLVPLKAVLMNLLSIGAAYGVIVAVFQWGWGASLLGVEPGPVEAWAPLMLFAILFGLSMDYEVFLLSRIREDYERTRDNAEAVAHGLGTTARVITASAAVMIAVFTGLALSSTRSLQLFGLGLATAVLVDATVVRLVLVPATMELLGDRNWWLPRWLDRILPSIHIEGSRRPSSAPASMPDRG